MKIWVITKRRLLMMAAFTLLAVGLVTVQQDALSGVVSALCPNKELPIYCVQTAEKKAALTFDAAWGEKNE
jgi:hypothetical protein